MLRIEGAVARPTTLTLEDLRDRYPRYDVDTVYANDERTMQASFAGARLWDILGDVGVVLNTEQPELMRVMVRAADRFRCIVKWQEFDPAADNKLILIGYLQNGEPIQGKHGPLRLVVPGDKQGQRYIGNLATITVLNNRARDE